jgi:hypothetical protein
MSTQLPGTLVSHDALEAEHNFLPDFAWAAVGGSVFLAACAVLFTLTVTWGGMRLGAPMPDGGVASLSSYNRELAAIFMAGFLVILVARSLTVRKR